MAQYLNPFPQHFDADGPFAFYKVYFGEPNQDPKSFPKVPYSDDSLTTSVSATQTLDAGGFYSIPLYLSGAYSVRIESTLGALVKEIPRVFGAGASPQLSSIDEAKAIDLGDIDFLETISANAGWEGTARGPIGGAKWYRTGGTGSVGTEDLANGRFYDAVGNEFELIQDQVINVYMFRSRGDGVTDDNTPFVNAVAYCAYRGGTDLYAPTGEYVLSGGFGMPSDSKLYGAGYGTNFLTADPLFLASGATNTIIEDVRFTLHNPIRPGGLQLLRYQNAAGNHKISRCWFILDNVPYATSLWGLAQINTGTNPAATEVTIENCYFEHTSGTALWNKGIRVRIGTDTTEVRFKFYKNVVVMDAAANGDLALECWGQQSDMQDNILISVNQNSPFGVTVGNASQQTFSRNRVIGFNVGIEVGATNEGVVIVSENTTTGCKQGFTNSSGGEERSLIITGNMFIFDDDIRTDYTLGADIKSKSPTITGNVFAHVKPSAELVYTDVSSRAYTGISMDTSNKSPNISGNTFLNLLDGIKAGPTGEQYIISGNTFNNVSQPINDFGGNPTGAITGNTFYNFNACLVSGVTTFTGNIFVRESDFPLSLGTAVVGTAPYAQAAIAANTIIKNIGNEFVNCGDTMWVTNTAFAISAGSFGRPNLEKSEHYWKIGNFATYTLADAEMNTVTGGSQPYDLQVQTYVQNATYIRRRTVQTVTAFSGDQIEDYNGAVP